MFLGLEVGAYCLTFLQSQEIRESRDRFEVTGYHKAPQCTNSTRLIFHSSQKIWLEMSYLAVCIANTLEMVETVYGTT